MKPSEVRAFIESRTRLYQREPVSDRQKCLTAGMLESCFSDDDANGATKKRRSVLKFLTGYDSMKNVPGQHVLALLDWLKPTRVDGVYEPSEQAVKDARAIVNAHLEAEGQERWV